MKTIWKSAEVNIQFPYLINGFPVRTIFNLSVQGMYQVPAVNVTAQERGYKQKSR